MVVKRFLTQNTLATSLLVQCKQLKHGLLWLYTHFVTC